MIKIDDVPQDVLWVWGIQIADRPIGLDTLNKIKVIIKANPKYFPWETKYDSIPKEVHDAYWKEKNHEADKRWAEYVEGKEQDGGFIGLIPSLMKMDEIAHEPIPAPAMSLSEVFSNLLKQQEDQRKLQLKEDKKNKSIWDKYYKPYGLEYRK